MAYGTAEVWVSSAGVACSDLAYDFLENYKLFRLLVRGSWGRQWPL